MDKEINSDAEEMDVFDENQTHTDHNHCFVNCEIEEAFQNYILPSVKEGDILGCSPNQVSNSLGDEIPSEVIIRYLGIENAPVRLTCVLACEVDEKRSHIVSFFPESEGVEVEVTLTEIHEWATGIEATLDGEILGEEGREISFFDTRYAEHKGKYEIGKKYKFKLCAFAYSLQFLPEEYREIRIEGKDAEERRKEMGEEPKYDSDGNPEPIVYSMTSAVACISGSNAYPDDYEYLSPTYSEIEELQVFDLSFIKVDICIARAVEVEEEIVVPLIANKSIVQEIPKKGDSISGHLWLQGVCVDKI